MEERLRKFSTLIELGSFTKAAKVLHISQPALTTPLKKLERELKAELLVRGSHPLQATNAGKLALTATKNLNVNRANLQLELAKLANRKPQLTIGMIDSVVELLFAYGDGL